MTTDNNGNIALTRLNLTKNLLADTTPSKIYDNYKLQVIHCLRLRPRPTGAKEAMPGPLNPKKQVPHQQIAAATAPQTVSPSFWAP